MRKTGNAEAVPNIFFLADEMSDITFSRSFYILMEAMITSLISLFRLSEDQINAFEKDFYGRLAKYIQEALCSGAQAA